MKPTFIGIGAQKCASTWLHHILASHPAVSLPALKEADFFSYRFDHGYQWYERLFSGCDPRRLTGEVSPSYFHDPTAPARVRAYRPDIRILLTLRDPVQRAMSNHRHEVRLGHLVGEDRSFEAGLANNPMYVEQGMYAKHLGNWLACFPRDQLFIALMDDVEADPAGVARKLFRFLDIDEDFRPEALTTRFNQSKDSRSDKLYRAKEQVYRMTRSSGLAWLWSAASGFGLRSLYRKLNIVELDAPVPSMRPATERALRAQFAPDINLLEKLLDRSLAGWGYGEADAPQQGSCGDARASEVEQWATR